MYTIFFRLALPLLGLGLFACTPEARNYEGGAGGGSSSSGSAGGGGGCAAGLDDCNGDGACETPTTDDPKNCGGCGVICQRACVAGVCDDPAHIAAGYQHSCAVTALGHLYCWGNNGSGELGIGSTFDDAGVNLDAPSPMEVPTAGPVVLVSASGVPTFNNPPTVAAHTCAVLADTTVQCWGSNGAGELGIGNGGWQDKPVTVVSLVGAAEVRAGGRHTCAVTKDGKLFCWGSNEFGQLGNGQLGTDVDKPTSIFDQVEKLATGALHTCVTRKDGTLQCWGKNNWGQIGIGSMQDQSSPALVSLTGVEGVCAGGEHTCVIKAGQVYCWGNGYQGQLGIENEFDWNETPTVPSAMPGAAAISCGRQHTAAIGATDGGGYSFGGTVPPGNGNPSGDYVPVAVALADIAEIAAGGGHTCALTKKKEILCWGANDHGQVGNGAISPDPVLTPVLVTIP